MDLTAIKQYVTYIVAALVVAASFAAGYNTRKAGEVNAAREQVKVVTEQVKVDDAAQQRQAAKLSDDLLDAQIQSLNLERQLQDLQQSNASLLEQITHAHLDAPQVAGSCPDAYSGREFGRLYDAAAEAAPAH